MHAREAPPQRDEVRRERPQGSAAPRPREEPPAAGLQGAERGKAEGAGGARPCAVIGPERVPPGEPWSLADVVPYRFSGPAAKPPPEHLYPPRNISPRQTYQENMRRILVPPRSDLTTPSTNFSLDNNIQISNVKLNSSADLKYCEVPYVINQTSKEPRSRIVRSGDIYTSAVPVASVPARAWPTPASAVAPAYYQPDVHYYGEYQNCAMPAIRSTKPAIKKTTEDLPLVYNENYYRGGDVRFEPYSASKAPRARYEYFPNPQPTYFPTPQKYDSTRPVPPHTYVGYAAHKVPQKYIDSRVIDANTEAYTRQTQYIHNLNAVHPGEYNVSTKFATPTNTNTLQSKVYGYPLDSGLCAMPAPKGPYDMSRPYFDYDYARLKQVSENPYTSEISYGFRGQIPINNYPTNNVPQGSQNYMYYPRLDNAPPKNYPEHLAQYRPTEVRQSMHNPLAKIPTQFSPNVISPSESNTSTESVVALGTSQEDCGYVSQCSTTSGKSIDYPLYKMQNYDYNMRSYDGRMFFPSSNSTPTMKTTLREYHQSTTSTVKNNKGIDLRQFLQTWDEDNEDVCGKTKTNSTVASQMEKNTISGPDTSENQEPLYVLGLVNIPSEEVSKYEHIQKVCKLPENIKGYDSADLLNKFDEACNAVSCNVDGQDNSDFQKNCKKTTALEAAMLEVVGPARPLSPLDVEAKITQSVIHKEVGCNFEIKPCSPLPKSVNASPALESLLGERQIEKVVNQSNLLPSLSTEHQIDFIDKGAKCGEKRRSQGKDSDFLNNKIIKTAETSCVLNTNEGDYNIVGDKEYNTVTGMCLASLPRLDNILELNFPEINQQYSDLKHKQESVITSVPISSASQENGVKQDAKFGKNNASNSNYNLINTRPYVNENNEAKQFGVQSVDMKENFNCYDYDQIIPISPNGQFNEKGGSKLSKFRKSRPTEITNISSDIINNRVESPQLTTSVQRTDSVIIKNPDNIENTLPTLDLTAIAIKNNEKNKSPWTHSFPNQLGEIKTDDSNVQEIYSKSPINLIMHSHYEEYTECIRPSLIHCVGPQSESMIERNSNITSYNDDKACNSSSDSNNKTVLTNKKDNSKCGFSDIPINVAINLSINSNHPEVAGDVLLKPYSPQGIRNEEEESDFYAANTIPCELKEKNDTVSFISECAGSENVMAETQTSTDLPCLFEPIGENEEIGVESPTEKAWEIPCISEISKDLCDKVHNVKDNRLCSERVLANKELKSKVELGQPESVGGRATLDSCAATSTTQDNSDLPVSINECSSRQLISDNESENYLNKSNQIIGYQCKIEENNEMVVHSYEANGNGKTNKSKNPKITNTTLESESDGIKYQSPDESINSLCRQSTNNGDDKNVKIINGTKVKDDNMDKNVKIETDVSLFQVQEEKNTYQDDHGLDEQMEENIENIALHIIATKDIFNKNDLKNDLSDHYEETTHKIKDVVADLQTCNLQGILSEACPSGVTYANNQTNSLRQTSDVQGILSEEFSSSHNKIVTIDQSNLSTHRDDENFKLAIAKKENVCTLKNLELFCKDMRESEHHTDVKHGNTTGLIGQKIEDKSDQASIFATIDIQESEISNKTGISKNNVDIINPIDLEDTNQFQNYDNIDISLGARDVVDKEGDSANKINTTCVEFNSIEQQELKFSRSSVPCDIGQRGNAFEGNIFTESCSTSEDHMCEHVEDRIKEEICESDHVIEIKQPELYYTEYSVPDDVKEKSNIIVGNVTNMSSSKDQTCEQIENRMKEAICDNNDVISIKQHDLNVIELSVSDDVDERGNMVVGNSKRISHNQSKQTTKESSSMRECQTSELKQVICDDYDVETKQPEHNATECSMLDDVEKSENILIQYCNTFNKSCSTTECQTSEQIDDRLKQAICDDNDDMETKQPELNSTECSVSNIVEERGYIIVGNGSYESSSMTECQTSEQIDNRFEQVICDNNNDKQSTQPELNSTEFSMLDYVEKRVNLVVVNTSNKSSSTRECQTSEQIDNRFEQVICDNNDDIETTQPEENSMECSGPDDLEEIVDIVVINASNESSSMRECQTSEQRDNRIELSYNNDDMESKHPDLNSTESSVFDDKEERGYIAVGNTSNESSSMRECQISKQIDNRLEQVTCNNNDDIKTTQPEQNSTEFSMPDDVEKRVNMVVGSTFNKSSSTRECQTSEQIDNIFEQVICDKNDDIETTQPEENSTKCSASDDIEERGYIVVGNASNESSTMRERQTSEQIDNKVEQVICDNNDDMETKLSEQNFTECLVSDDITERVCIVVSNAYYESSSMKEFQTSEQIDNRFEQVICDNNDDMGTKLPEPNFAECLVSDDITERVCIVVGNACNESSSMKECPTSEQIDNRFEQVICDNNDDMETKLPEPNFTECLVSDDITERVCIVVGNASNESSSMRECQTSEQIDNKFEQVICDNNDDMETKLPEPNFKECLVSDDITERVCIVAGNAYNESSSIKEFQTSEQIDNRFEQVICDNKDDMETKLPEPNFTECLVSDDITERVCIVVGNASNESSSMRECQTSEQIDNRLEQVTCNNLKTKHPELNSTECSVSDDVEERGNAVVDSPNKSSSTYNNQTSEQINIRLKQAICDNDEMHIKQHELTEMECFVPYDLNEVCLTSKCENSKQLTQQLVCKNNDKIATNELELSSSFDDHKIHKHTCKEAIKNVQFGNISDVNTKFFENNLESKCRQDMLKFSERQFNVLEINKQDSKVDGNLSLFSEYYTDSTESVNAEPDLNDRTASDSTLNVTTEQDLNDQTASNDVILENIHQSLGEISENKCKPNCNTSETVKTETIVDTVDIVKHTEKTETFYESMQESSTNTDLNVTSEIKSTKEIFFVEDPRERSGSEQNFVFKSISQNKEFNDEVKFENDCMDQINTISSKAEEVSEIHIVNKISRENINFATECVITSLTCDNMYGEENGSLFSNYQNMEDIEADQVSKKYEIEPKLDDPIVESSYLQVPLSNTPEVTKDYFQTNREDIKTRNVFKAKTSYNDITHSQITSVALTVCADRNSHLHRKQKSVLAIDIQPDENSKENKRSTLNDWYLGVEDILSEDEMELKCDLINRDAKNTEVTSNRITESNLVNETLNKYDKHQDDLTKSPQNSETDDIIRSCNPVVPHFENISLRPSHSSSEVSDNQQQQDNEKDETSTSCNKNNECEAAIEIPAHVISLKLENRTNDKTDAVDQNKYQIGTNDACKSNRDDLEMYSKDNPLLDLFPSLKSHCFKNCKKKPKYRLCTEINNEYNHVKVGKTYVSLSPVPISSEASNKSHIDLQSIIPINDCSSLHIEDKKVGSSKVTPNLSTEAMVEEEINEIQPIESITLDQNDDIVKKRIEMQHVIEGNIIDIKLDEDKYTEIFEKSDTDIPNEDGVINLNTTDQIEIGKHESSVDNYGSTKDMKDIDSRCKHLKISNDIKKSIHSKECVVETKDTSIVSINNDLNKEVYQKDAEKITNNNIQPVQKEKLLGFNISKKCSSFHETKHLNLADDNKIHSDVNENLNLIVNKKNTNPLYSSDKVSGCLSKKSEIIILETGMLNLPHTIKKKGSSRWDQKERSDNTLLNYSNKESILKTSASASALASYKAADHNVINSSVNSILISKQSSYLKTKEKLNSTREPVSETDHIIKRKRQNDLPSPITHSNNTDLSSGLAFIFENLYRKRRYSDQYHKHANSDIRSPNISNTSRYENNPAVHPYDSLNGNTEKFRRRHISNFAELFFSDKESETQRLANENKTEEISNLLIHTHSMREKSLNVIENEITSKNTKADHLKKDIPVIISGLRDINDELSSRLSECQGSTNDVNESRLSDVVEVYVRKQNANKNKDKSQVVLNAFNDIKCDSNSEKEFTVNKSTNKRKSISDVTENMLTKEKNKHKQRKGHCHNKSEDVSNKLDIVGVLSDINSFAQKNKEDLGNNDILTSASDDCSYTLLGYDSTIVENKVDRVNVFKSTSEKHMKYTKDSMETMLETNQEISQNMYIPLCEEGKLTDASESNKYDVKNYSKVNSKKDGITHGENDLSIMGNIVCEEKSMLCQESVETSQISLIDNNIILPEQIICMEPDSTQECHGLINTNYTDNEEVNNSENEKFEDFSSNECNTDLTNQICANSEIVNDIQLELIENGNDNLLQTTNQEIKESEECDSSQNNDSDNNAVIFGITYVEEVSHHINSTLMNTESSYCVRNLSSANECLLVPEHSVSPENILQCNDDVGKINFERVAEQSEIESDSEIHCDKTLSEDGCLETSISPIAIQTLNPLSLSYDDAPNEYERLDNSNPTMEYEEIWIDDVACVETVVCEDIEEEEGEWKSEHELSIAVETPDIDQTVETDNFSMSFNSAKMKNIYGNGMDNNDINLLETLYKTPHMDVRNKLNKNDLSVITLDRSLKTTNKNSKSEKDSLHEQYEMACLANYGSENSDQVDISSQHDKSDTLLTCPEKDFIENQGFKLMTESEKNASSEVTSNFDYPASKKVLTKAARKYIPPIKLAFHNLKVKLPLPEESLVKLKELKVKKQPQERTPIPKLKIKTSNLNKNIQTETGHHKKVKPKFEDVLKHIDDAHYKLTLKSKNKRNINKGVPKVIIKKTDNGSQYTSKAVRNDYNRDLTGRKWQPWVYLEKNELIDHMIAKKNTNAFFCHQSKEFVLQPKSPKPDIALKASPILIIKPQYSVDGSGHQPLKYTITLNPRCNVDNIPNRAQKSHTSHISKPAPSK